MQIKTLLNTNIKLMYIIQYKLILVYNANEKIQNTNVNYFHLLYFLRIRD